MQEELKADFILEKLKEFYKVKTLTAVTEKLGNVSQPRLSNVVKSNNVKYLIKKIREAGIFDEFMLFIKNALPYEKELNDIGVYIIRNDDNYELQLKNKSIITDISCDSIEDLKDELIKDMEHHLQMIESEDENYFKNNNSKYLKTKWKKLINSILDILKNQIDEELLKRKQEEAISEVESALKKLYDAGLVLITVNGNAVFYRADNYKDAVKFTEIIKG